MNAVINSRPVILALLCHSSKLVVIDSVSFSILQTFQVKKKKKIVQSQTLVFFFFKLRSCVVENSDSMEITSSSTPISNIVDCTYLSSSNQLCICQEDGSVCVYFLQKELIPSPADTSLIKQASEKDNQPSFSLTEISLKNLNPMLNPQLDKLEFQSYAEWNIPQISSTDKSGTTSHFLMPKEEDGDWRFELDFPTLQVVDHIQLTLGFLAQIRIQQQQQLLNQQQQLQQQQQHQNQLQSNQQNPQLSNQQQSNTSSSTTSTSTSSNLPTVQISPASSSDVITHSSSMMNIHAHHTLSELAETRFSNYIFNTFLTSGEYAITVRYLSEENKWVEALNRFDLTPLIASSTESNDSTPFSVETVSSRSLSVGTHFTARRMLLVLHSVKAPDLELETEESSDSESDSESDEETKPKKIALPPRLGTMSVTLFGIRHNLQNGIQYRQKRQQFFSSQEFHLALLRVAESSTTGTELRNTCLKLLSTIFSTTPDLDHILSNIELDSFLEANLILGGSITAKLASKLLQMAAQTSDQFEKKLFNALIHSFPDMVDICQSGGGMFQYFHLLNSCWQINPSRAIDSCVEILSKLGDLLYEHRSPFYNLLRAHFSLDGVPLENDIFAHKSMEEYATAPDSDLLGFKVASKSSNVVAADKKPDQIRFLKLQKTGNWITVDFGSLCLLTGKKN